MTPTVKHPASVMGVICHWWSRSDSVRGEGRDVQYMLVYQGVEPASALVCTAFISWRRILPAGWWSTLSQDQGCEGLHQSMPRDGKFWIGQHSLQILIPSKIGGLCWKRTSGTQILTLQLSWKPEYYQYGITVLILNCWTSWLCLCLTSSVQSWRLEGEQQSTNCQ